MDTYNKTKQHEYYMQHRDIILENHKELVRQQGEVVSEYKPRKPYRPKCTLASNDFDQSAIDFYKYMTGIEPEDMYNISVPLKRLSVAHLFDLYTKWANDNDKCIIPKRILTSRLPEGLVKNRSKCTWKKKSIRYMDFV
tara:strand:+ start:2682 stop:3098 length:417 start_codon:yes stop_codon:yes gene_type:complete